MGCACSDRVRGDQSALQGTACVFAACAFTACVAAVYRHWSPDSDPPPGQLLSSFEMRAFLIALLLLVVPLQASWAAVGGYCQHESGEAAQHVGHHEHQHESNFANDYVGKDIVEETTALNSLGIADSDCAVCHATATAILTTSIVPPHADILSASLSRPPDQALSAIAYPPERPNWLALA